MVDFLISLAVIAAADVFYVIVLGPWIRKRPVKGAFVRPRYGRPFRRWW
jgi:hypothetical protein